MHVFIEKHFGNKYTSTSFNIPNPVQTVQTNTQALYVLLPKKICYYSITQQRCPVLYPSIEIQYSSNCVSFFTQLE